MDKKIKDMSDCVPLKVHSGANIKKVSPGMNTQIVPPTPTEG